MGCPGKDREVERMNQIALNVDCMESVSYTHLDVYKRQCRNRDGRKMTSAVNLEKAICKEENDGKQNDFAGAALL